MPHHPHYDAADLPHFLADALQATVSALQCACDARVPLQVHQALVSAHAALLAAELHMDPPKHREGIVDDCPF